MTTIISILGLLAAWAILANLERLPWPPQRHSALYDQQYWECVQRDTAAYLATHSKGINAETRRTVEAMRLAAQQRLGGLAR